MSTNPSAFGNAPTGPAGGALGGTYPNPTFGNGVSWQPSDNNLLLANGDPWPAGGSSFLAVAGTVYLMKLTARSALTVTNVWLDLAVAGSGASTGSFVGLYSSAGTLLSGSSDIATSLTGTAGPISNALTTPQALAAGSFVWVAFLVNLATTQPTLSRQGSAPSMANANLTAANFRFAVNGTVQSSLPASITPGSNAAPTGGQYWVGVS